MDIEYALEHKISNIVLISRGRVIRILDDDETGTPHQRFIMEAHPSHTVLVVNNVERAYRVPIKVGDVVEVKGNFVYNKYGGLIHETHHHEEPDHHEDGYITLVK